MIAAELHVTRFAVNNTKRRELQMMAQDKESRTFFEFILKYFLPMHLIENANVKNRVRVDLIRAMVDAGLENLSVPLVQNQSPVSSGSRLDGLSVPDHFIVSSAGSEDGSRWSHEVADMDEMTVLDNLFVGKDGVSKSRIFDTEPTRNPLYIRLHLTKEYVKLAKREGYTLPRSEYLGTRAVTDTAMDGVSFTAKAMPPESQLTEILGPAASSVNAIPGIKIQAALSYDNVIAFRHNLWPAEEWVHRHRKSGWPDKGLVHQCVSAGCYIVPVGPGGLQGLEWRYSFTAQERLLANSLTLLQKKVHIIMKLIQRHCVLEEFPSTALSSYHLKNVLFWLCEKIPRSHWTEPNIYHLLITFLNEMLGCLVRGCLPHYFVPEGNLFARVPKAHLRQLARSVKKSRNNMIEVLGTLGKKVKFTDIYDARSPMFLFIQSLQSQPTASFQQILVSTLGALTDDYIRLIRHWLGEIKASQAKQPDGLKSKDNEEKDRNTLNVLSTPTSQDEGLQQPKDGASETAGEWIHYQGLYHIALNNLTECLQLAVCDMENLRMNTACQPQHTREFLLTVMMKYMAKHSLEPSIVVWILSYINFKTEKHMNVKSTLENSLALYEKNDPTALTREEYNTWKLSVSTAADHPVVSECLPNAEWHKRIIMVTDPNLLQCILNIL
ncbi:uncharacterized protein LOC106178685 isoform X1 [Lingula anatina]|uniref:Uncharacterized protein LOC106178685 isoform X1 n=2 Tax=Lingula anatina TaxID=7574 RepID=A0A1S3K467_LINAN|nr:uncharacterized protein LOC106178685 isoform X1 [Lingula anatina]|eukprot:XP_013417428.2 uncharacterized protein LOC106178685 isoform X1 [Lingula anatina]